MLTKAPRGTKDVAPKESYKWQYLEDMFRKVCKDFGYHELRTPTFEHTELFERGVGETTDVVQKEMYTFEDKGGRSITLKAEGTAPAARLYVENKLYADPQPIKTFYVTPVFRYERPQKGRLREHHQFGVEVYGSENPSVDSEVISIVDTLYKKLGITNVELQINSIGCPECRGDYDKALKDYLESKLENLCDTCNSRFDKNPMRILDCKNHNCQTQLEEAPVMIDYLCEECNVHFEGVKKYLDVLDIDYLVNPRIVRGLDYYSKTAFEFISSEIGAKSTVCGGGRYDGLVKEIGGPETAAIGFGMGMERLLLTLENNNIEIPKPEGLDIFIVTMGEKARELSMKLVNQLRRIGISSDMDHLDRSVKAQFKYSNKIDATYTIVIGEDEIDKDVLSIKNMKTGEQEEIKLSNLVESIKVKLGR
ncbi:histidine--tRNA ligase [Clostridium sp. D2Q-11]|uniref:Histidine--tRNA ligase n=1 Tax=Anaeromonas frigoriresistens TaxID=2683708 RepID=A0A942UY15_9FIRM|nr:histidine--tRNA ligase [Anaeromonas frigoriresistens]MBS4539695.1 histidine--tRNA ligase [Anaeromonas frigoriresistens]